MESELKNQKIRKGKTKAKIIFSVLVTLGIAAVISSAIIRNDWSINHLGSRLIRLALEIALFISLFNGKSWSKTILNILFTFGILSSIFLIIGIIGKGYYWIILLVVIAVYAIALYIFNTDDDFDAFFTDQQRKSS